MAIVLSALRTSRGNVEQAAQTLGTSRQRPDRMLGEAEKVDLTAPRAGGEIPSR
jgi:hypothetical protein